MRTEFSWTPKHEGIFGPEIIINAATGVGCLRHESGKVVGNAPEHPATNAFVVWLGRPIVVISEGVRTEDIAPVARGVRELLEDPTVPIVVSLGQVRGQYRAMSDQQVAFAEPELARAEGYVLVQAAWLEGDAISIELNGRQFDLRVAFRLDSSGRLLPYVE